MTPTRWLAALVAAALLSPAAAAAQEDEATAYWYVSEYQIPWEKADSLQALLDADTELVREAVRRGHMVESMALLHHTGGEHNLVFMTKYPSWAAIDADPGLGPIAEELWGADRRQARGDAWDWIFETSGGAHKDAIYAEAAAVP